jgi:hypothetical protein
MNASLIIAKICFSLSAVVLPLCYYSTCSPSYLYCTLQYVRSCREDPAGGGEISHTNYALPMKHASCALVSLPICVKCIHLYSFTFVEIQITLSFFPFTDLYSLAPVLGHFKNDVWTILSQRQ